MIYLSLDVYALLCALWLLRFAVKSRQTVSIYWSYFVIFVYLVIIIKYVLHIETTFNLNSGNICNFMHSSKYVMMFLLLFLNINCFTETSWKTINFINNSTIMVYDVSYNALIRPLTCKMCTENLNILIIYFLNYSTAFDFILLVFASHLLTVFKKENSQLSQGNYFQENNNTISEYVPDYLSQNKFVWIETFENVLYYT